MAGIRWSTVATLVLVGCSNTIGDPAVGGGPPSQGEVVEHDTTVEMADLPVEPRVTVPGPCGSGDAPEPPADPRVSLRLDVDGPVKPGAFIRFEWSHGPGWEIIQRHSAVVECWTGEKWIDAWIVSDQFMKYGPPDAVGLDEPFDPVDEGVTLPAGRVVVAEGAVPGVYRLNPGASICDVTDPDDEVCERLLLTARFEVE